MRFEIHAPPVSQGSMVPVINWKLHKAWMRHAQGEAINVWRAKVREAYKEAGGTLVASGAVRIAVRFGCKRPANPTNSYPIGDVDKYLRGLLDALTGTAYNDDSQVVQAYAIKAWGERTIVIIEQGYAEWMDEYSAKGFDEGQLSLRFVREVEPAR